MTPRNPKPLPRSWRGDTRNPTMKLTAQNVFSKIGQHSFLIALAVMFSFPFVWMITTSAKVDREMFAEKRTLFPKAPNPRIVSPYIDTDTFDPPAKPEDVQQEYFARLKEPIMRALESAERKVHIPVCKRLKTAADQEVLEGLFDRVTALAPYASWTNAALSPARVARRATTRKEILSAFDKCYRHFSLRLSRVRDDELRVHNLALDTPVTSQWSSLKPAAAFLEERADAELSYADVHYSFEDTNTISLRADFDLSFPASNLFQYTLGYRSDDTWHRLYVTIEGGGRKLASEKPVYLFDFYWVATPWQCRSEQDKEAKVKRWTVMDVIDTGEQYDFGPNKIRVTLTLRQSNRLQAWWGKLTRNYTATFKYIPFWRYIGTSAFLVILNIMGALFASTIVAYAFARLRWPGRDICFMLLLATLMIPPQVTMIPGFIIMKWFGWYNTLQPLWVFSFCGNAFFIFLLRQFMKGIPNDLEDAARIDGCGFLRIYWYVVLPLVKPTMAAIAIFTFMGVWNDFMGPLIYLNDHRLYPISLGLFSLNVQAGGNFGMMMASSFLMTLPVIIIFFFAQKYFIQGVTLTGMKG